MTPTARLAEWCASTPHAWPDAAREAVRRAFVDTIATILAGRHEPCTVAAREAVSQWGSGPCFTAGGSRLAAPWAALVNGTAAHALDYDDVQEPALNHPSAGLVPALRGWAFGRTPLKVNCCSVMDTEKPCFKADSTARLR